MSHTTTIKAIKITNLAALRAAVAELASAKGIKISIEENAKPRAYFADQQGMGVAPIVLRLADSPYDVGVYPSNDGSYELRADFFKGAVAKILGSPVIDPARAEQSQLGKLFQAYALNAAQMEARKKGYTTRRVPGQNGVEKLVVTGF